MCVLCVCVGVYVYACVCVCVCVVFVCLCVCVCVCVCACAWRMYVCVREWVKETWRQKESAAMQGKNTLPSTIFYQPMDTWSKADWTIHLNGDEEGVCCAIGDKWVVVATTENYL